jgi:hypothetical protein
VAAHQLPALATKLALTLNHRSVLCRPLRWEISPKLSTIASGPRASAISNLPCIEGWEEETMKYKILKWDRAVSEDELERALNSVAENYRPILLSAAQGSPQVPISTIIILEKV